MRFWVIIAFIFIQCRQADQSKVDFDFPPAYDQASVKKIFLPKRLEEISGIAWAKDGLIWAIEDESSAVYGISPESGKVIAREKFDKNKDIEDLLKIGDTAWVLQSNGNLFRVKRPLSEYHEVEKFEFPVKRKRDFEGMVYLDSIQSILVFCKVCSWDKNSGQASVFRFDLERLSFDPKPFTILTYSSLSGIKKFGKPIKIQPSAAALHPIEQTIYLLSSTDKWLMILSKNLAPTALFKLDPQLFKQPEGITFDEEGNMFISNEAQDGQANLLFFPYQR